MGWGDCLKCLKRGWNRTKIGGKTKNNTRKVGMLGKRVGTLKSWGDPLFFHEFIICTFQLKFDLKLSP